MQTTRRHFDNKIYYYIFSENFQLFSMYILAAPCTAASLQSHDRVEHHASSDQLMIFRCKLGLDLAICYEVNRVGVVLSRDSGNNSVMSRFGNGERDWLRHRQ